MKRTHLTLGAAIILVGAASFVAGRMSVDREPAEDQETSALPAKSQRAERGASASSGPASGRSATGPTSLGDQDELITGMRSALDRADPVDRTRAWLDFLDELSDDEFIDVITAFHRDHMEGLADVILAWPQNRMGEYAMLLSAWARTDPNAAVDFNKQTTGNSFARQTALASWTISDPDAALRWAEANHDGDGANPWLIGVIRGMVGTDPDRATGVMLSMPNSRERDQALSAILPAVLEQGAASAREWAMAITDEQLRDGAIRGIAEEFASTDPAGTADFLVTNPGEAARRTMDRVFSSWMRTDDTAALSYFQDLPSGEARSNALRGIVNVMAREDPHEAAAFIDNHQADATDRLFQQFVWRSYDEEPEIAADYIGSIDNQELRDQTYSLIIDHWLRQDEPAAMSWLSGNTLPEPVVNHLERRMEERPQQGN